MWQDTRLRWAITACVALCLLILVSWVRLDVAKVLRDNQLTLASDSHITFSFSHASLSIMHGIGVSIDDFDMRDASWHIRAPSVFVGLNVGALLLGEVRPASLFFQMPEVELRLEGQSNGLMPLLQAFDLEELNIIKGVLRVDGQPYFDKMQMDIRDLGENREMRWELMAHHRSQLLQSHGRAMLTDEGITSGFAKLKFEHIPMPASLAKKLSETLPPGFPVSHISSALTVDVANRAEWYVFGEMSLENAGNTQAMNVRAKLHSNDGLLSWEDAFVNLGQGLVVEASGQCHGWQSCQADFKGRSLSLEKMRTLPWLHVSEGWRGKLDLATHLDWQHQALALQGQISWPKLTSISGEQEMVLPDGVIEMQNATWSAKTGLMVEQGQARVGETMLSLQDVVLAKSHWQAGVQVKQAGRSWRPLANIMLHQYGIDQPLSGDGDIAGDMFWQASDDGAQQLRLKLDASKASIQWGDRVNKPMNQPAALQAEWRKQAASKEGGSWSLQLQDLSFGRTRMQTMQLKQEQNHYQLKVTDGEVDFDQGWLNWPAMLDVTEVRGKLKGTWSLAWEHRLHWRSVLPEHLSGQLSMQQWGINGHELTGELAADAGRLSFQNLQWKDGLDNSLLSGEIDLLHQRGRVDVEGGRWEQSGWQQWQSMMPEGLMLSGKLSQVSMQYLDNPWFDLHGQYRMSHQHIELKNFSATLANGWFKSRRLILSTGEQGLHAQGDIRVGNVHLDKIKALDEALQASMGGRLYANVLLDGGLPMRQGWRGNGDMVIYSGHWQPHSDVNPHVYRFRQLGAHVEVLPEKGWFLSSIRLQSGENVWQGKLSLDVQEQFSGAMTDQKGRDWHVSGSWPYPVWAATPAAPTKAF